MTPDELQAGLGQFYCSEVYYEHWLGRLVYTEGVKFLAENAGAYWLLDAIASYQPQPEVASEPFQIWTLVVKDRSGTLSMRADSNRPVLVSQEIEFTDFPLPEFKLWLTDGVLILPSEY